MTEEERIKKAKFKELVAHFLPIVKKHRVDERLISIMTRRRIKRATATERTTCRVCSHPVGSADCKGWKGVLNGV